MKEAVCFLTVSLLVGTAFGQNDIVDDRDHYKFNGNYIGVYTRETGITYQFEAANDYCDATFGTTLATWSNYDEQSEANGAKFVPIPRSYGYAWAGIKRSSSDDSYYFIDGSGIADDSNTVFSNEYGDCTIFDETLPSKDYCGTYSVQSNNCELNSYTFVCNAPEYYQGIEWSLWSSKTFCQAYVYYNNEFDDDGGSGVAGPYDVGYYEAGGCPGFINDGIVAAKLIASDGYDCSLTMGDGPGSVNQFTVIARSGQTVYVNGDTPGMTGGISVVEVYYKEEKTLEDLSCIETQGCVNSVLSGYEYDTIRCYGYDSCLDNTLEVVTNAVCIGFGSCFNSIITSNDRIECTGTNGCMKGTMNAVNAALCDGLQSCSGGSITTINDFVHCGGNLGCASSTLPDTSLITTINSATDVYCVGRLSCYSAQGVISSGDSATNEYGIVCAGDHSCSNVATANLFITNRLDCGGQGACRDSNFENINMITATGPYGLYKASVFGNDGNSVDIYLTGYYAGLEAKITCSGSGTVCNLYCSGNGCNSVTFECDKSSVTNDPIATCNVICDDTVGVSSDCPTVTYITSAMLATPQYSQTDKLASIVNDGAIDGPLAALDSNKKMIEQAEQYVAKLNEEIEQLLLSKNVNKNYDINEHNNTSIMLIVFSALFIFVTTVFVTIKIYSHCNDINNDEYNYKPIN